MVNSSSPQELPESFWHIYRGDSLTERLEVILKEINHFFDHQETWQTPIQELSWWRLKRLWLRQKLARLTK